ncbi:MAG: 3-deoxy-7-phosphoheptulonate synthase [Treponema sp.]|jgi:3-deoxy-7-phosphoheptulonate synthase|nr:3-deoxy-7-phosphoheptulonate synthase [Treponema sp.]
MIIAIKQGVSAEETDHFAAMLERRGVKVDISRGASQTVLGLVGDTSSFDPEALAAHHLVAKVIRVQEPYKRANRLFHPEDTRIDILRGGGAEGVQGANGAAGAASSIGGGMFAVIAGPCSVESPEQIIAVARVVKAAGAAFLRGGAFKPRTSPYSFQGMGCEGVNLLLEAKKETGLPLVSELMEIHQLELFDGIDIIQVGARNMQNFNLLKELGRSRKPVLLKRGLASTVTELLMAAEYIMAGGNSRVILCERGIRTFESFARNTLDIAAVPWLKQKTHLPVLVDPSHATGIASLVPAAARAAAAAGADGLIVEVHNDPENALCDGEQSLTPAAFTELMASLRAYAELEGKRL